MYVRYVCMHVCMCAWFLREPMLSSELYLLLDLAHPHLSSPLCPSLLLPFLPASLVLSVSFPLSVHSTLPSNTMKDSAQKLSLSTLHMWSSLSLILLPITFTSYELLCSSTHAHLITSELRLSWVARHYPI